VKIYCSDGRQRRHCQDRRSTRGQAGSTKKEQAMSINADPNAVTAIDILLEPDATMLQRAQVVNDRLLKVFPKGFALDATHRPHITLLQRFRPHRES
jgi:hypothetical protein